jgi:hypothetical protein
MKKAAFKSGNHKKSSLKMTSPRKKGCATEFFPPEFQFTLNVTLLSNVLYSHCAFIPKKNPIVFLAKYPSPGIVFNFNPCFKSRIVL